MGDSEEKSTSGVLMEVLEKPGFLVKEKEQRQSGAVEVLRKEKAQMRKEKKNKKCIHGWQALWVYACTLWLLVVLESSAK